MCGVTSGLFFLSLTSIGSTWNLASNTKRNREPAIERLNRVVTELSRAFSRIPIKYFTPPTADPC